MKTSLVEIANNQKDLEFLNILSFMFYFPLKICSVLLLYFTEEYDARQSFITISNEERVLLFE